MTNNEVELEEGYAIFKVNMVYSLSRMPPWCLYLIVNWSDLFGDGMGDSVIKLILVCQMSNNFQCTLMHILDRQWCYGASLAYC